MENLNTSIKNQATTQRLPLVSRMARQLVLKQLSSLAHGKLVVREQGFEDQIFGDADSRYPKAEMVVHNHGAWRDLVTGGGIGAAEAYVAGDWSSPDLTALLRFSQCSAFSVGLLSQANLSSKAFRVSRLRLKNRSRAVRFGELQSPAT